MKVAACYCVYDDYEFLDISVKSIERYVDQIYFFVSYSRYDGTSVEGDNKLTLKCIEYLKLQFPNKVTLIRKDWKSQIPQRNESIEIIQKDGYDYCLIIDADEIYEPQHLDKLFQYCRGLPKVDIFLTQFYTYFKSIKYRIWPLQGLNATTLIKTHVQLNMTRGVKRAKEQGYIVFEIPSKLILWHHPSHVRTDERMQSKYAIAMHEYGLNKSWMRDVWARWTPETKNFHPSKPSAFQQVIELKKEQLPEVLWEIYDNEQRFLTGERWL
jgi:hypothetical protein